MNIVIYKDKVVASVHLSVYLFSHNSSLDGRRQKLIGALNSAGIGEGAKPKKSSKIFPRKLLVWKELKK
jgi:hypothetical protein